MDIFKLVNRFFSYLEKGVKTSLSPLAPYLRRLGIGVALIILSAVGWIVALIFFLMAFFLNLSNQAEFVNPALYTGCVGLGVAVLFLIAGFNLVRKPR